MMYCENSIPTENRTTTKGLSLFQIWFKVFVSGVLQNSVDHVDMYVRMQWA